MSKKISISFKETRKDMELYELLMSWEDKSHEIKEIIRKFLAGTLNEHQPAAANKPELDTDITDF